ncbi:hypothetical protein B0I35DRAFT_512922 [Stachybotrys elegans]|uniref:WSC domain-containing protein n=1 Tax=Stachybotrys elegans TaxID=80388 RepID=A0A8K0WQS7_9HYPO|nr:hypothetical protein B0I35DRAFT_512922 [Stachybotrys elegans]
MSRLLLTSLLATAVSAQANFAIDRFRYIGCVETSNPAAFGLTIDFTRPFSSEDCQGACAGRGGSATYAALIATCGCSIPGIPADYTVVDESRCNRLCIEGDESGGYCGGDDVYTLFQKKRQNDPRSHEEHCDDESKVAAETSRPPLEIDPPVQNSAVHFASTVFPAESFLPQPTFTYSTRPATAAGVVPAASRVSVARDVNAATVQPVTVNAADRLMMTAADNMMYEF